MTEISYKKEQDLKNIEKIREHLKNLPDFANSYFTFLLSVKNSSTRTVLNYVYDIEVFFYYLEQNHPDFHTDTCTLEFLENLTALDVQEYVDFLTLYHKNGIRYTNDAAGKSRKISSLRSFFNYYQNLQMIRVNPATLIPLPKKHKKNIIKLEKNEIKSVLNGASDGSSLTKNQRLHTENLRYRDIAIITLLLGTGVRVSECVGINIKDINFERSSIKIIRKGGNESYVYFTKEVEMALRDYIDYERKESETDPDALFISRTGTRLSVRSVERVVKKYTQNIIQDKKITPHKLRSTYGTNLYRESGDIYLTADALGHRNIAVTSEHYADIGDEKRKKASEYTEKWL